MRRSIPSDSTGGANVTTRRATAGYPTTIILGNVPPFCCYEYEKLEFNAGFGSVDGYQGFLLIPSKIKNSFYKNFDLKLQPDHIQFSFFTMMVTICGEWLQEVIEACRTPYLAPFQDCKLLPRTCSECKAAVTKGSDLDRFKLMNKATNRMKCTPACANP